MKNYKPSLAAAAALLLCSLIPELKPAAAQEVDRKVQSQAEKFYYLASQTGSNLSYAGLKLLKTKYPSLNVSADSLQHSLSPHSLRSGYFGEFLGSRRSAGFDGELDILTGKRAVDETLQLHSIDPAEPRWGQQNINPADLVPSIPVSEVEPLKIRSHPWNEMLKHVTVQKQPEIFKLVPRDLFFVYFKEMDKLSQLEGGLKRVAVPLSSMLNASSVLNLKQQVCKRLGIEKPEVFEPLVKEALFVSEDFDFYPGTHFALIVSFKSPLVGSLTELVASDKSYAAQIGNYAVLSTSEKLLESIRAVHADPQKSMETAEELTYAISALDPRKDGMVYLSEDFILKLVSPRYRIQAARRNAVLNKLEALQYSVFAYKVITGEWPKSLEAIVEQGYLDKQALVGGVGLDEGGIVRHAEWGTLYEVKPLSEVPLTLVSKREKERYEAFLGGYQSFWREFFDPVGVGITVSDRLYFHTIILPLIDHSDYRGLMSFIGARPYALSAVSNPPRATAVSLVTTLDMDGFILDNAQSFIPRSERDVKEISVAEKKALINEKIKLNLGLPEVLDVFDMFGNELILGVGGSQSLEITNLADADIFIGFALKDQERFKKLINQVYKVAFQNMGGRGATPISPFFSLSSEEPLKNEYKGHTFYMIPAGFTNLFFMYDERFVYFTISQLAINKLVDGFDKKSSRSPAMHRTLEYLPEKHNVLLTADLSEAGRLKEELISTTASGYYFDKLTRDLLGYVADVGLLAAASDEAAGEPSKYFRWVPAEIHGIQIRITEEGVSLGEKGAALTTVDLKALPNITYRINQEVVERVAPKGGVPVRSLVSPSFKDSIAKGWGDLGNIALSLAFTEHGLDTKVVFSNPLVTEPDERFECKPAASPESGTDKMLALGIAALILAGIVIVLIRGRRQR
ncbi:MAG: hypothetical protein J5J00_08470 [Deltaproteobacteria bacterium]|nr:hypothetical protein [Deltaproteobacteria bacterium]